jgi:hypothetical protein
MPRNAFDRYVAAKTLVSEGMKVEDACVQSNIASSTYHYYNRRNALDNYPAFFADSYRFAKQHKLDPKAVVTQFGRMMLKQREFDTKRSA